MLPDSASHGLPPSRLAYPNRRRRRVLITTSATPPDHEHPQRQNVLSFQTRRYVPGEEELLRQLFYNTIRNVNRRDYTLEQVQTWAPDSIDPEQWNSRIKTMNPFVCVTDEQIVGYAALLESGYVDHFYVHHLWQSRGVGRELMHAILDEATNLDLNELTSDVSITARPFFERYGFQVVTPQQVVKDGVVFDNFKMHRLLSEE
ncbi:putative N-acetyltransferase YafP [Thalassoglobus neptunius]|uniref:Putative N-acetyltransferase YafP n=1 Tax=Thalassoglobus neptunius TaxID=1938619 RepID=A0A5C5X4Y2_9PLAN|nr:GNAT family N-acetyltransferase [Thalassoglobus neptunius]TWT57788.1 putative N-acetyltransferase YafP [Thalassoglobus neptunius]